MADTPPPVSVSVRPEPTDDELAAILAAYRELWPAPADTSPTPSASLAWKFGGRWWLSQPRRPSAGATWR